VYSMSAPITCPHGRAFASSVVGVDSKVRARVTWEDVVPYRLVICYTYGGVGGIVCWPRGMAVTGTKLCSFCCYISPSLRRYGAYSTIYRVWWVAESLHFKSILVTSRGRYSVSLVVRYIALL
jgi:hypothetical protein